ncbi:putative glycerol-1-phosphate prenyltransferase [Cyclobacterium lianum]|uniref:Geranylgeranylglyceryl phosphate synthase n=1 Tax=Cyclobacterium lianum TaxID=388280 RepID=A0A1M7IGU0_9BACT|nr:geranylgeranylglyceryl/heptaprenylglyceryl phosphate synthase [Cyclobacterium lianum]SHM39930.1 putative glycerol-1-phosphate prenyltransferase [Cyclobacterium lianum]
MNRSTRLRDLLFERKSEGSKSLALLIDPEKMDRQSSFTELVQGATELEIDFIFIGGSLVSADQLAKCMASVNQIVGGRVPLVLFPGSVMQVSDEADAILFLSLISGRNPEWLIGQQVLAAPHLSKSKLEIIPTGYMLVNGGSSTSVEYISQTIPLPQDKPDLAAATALAGKYLGLSVFYMDAGSGARVPVSPDMIRAVNAHTKAPLIVGGGICSLSSARRAWEAGADVLVIGNGAEKNPSLIAEVLQYARWYNASLNVN